MSVRFATLLGLMLLLIGACIPAATNVDRLSSAVAYADTRPGTARQVGPSAVSASPNALLAALHSGVAFTMAGCMAVSRVVHSATLLQNGLVLVAGGNVWPHIARRPAAELYNPVTSSFAATGSLGINRNGHTATLLRDGRVLIAGGWNDSLPTIASAELYDPVTGRFTPTGQMQIGRVGHTATLLPGGQVLIVGGIATAFSALASAELFDPTTGTFTSTGGLTYGRMNHTATLLTNGTVLIAGGEQPIAKPDGTVQNPSVAAAEVYDPTTHSFHVSGSLLQDHDRHTATILASGQVLVVGGIDWPHGQFLLTTAELYNPATETFTRTGSLVMGREDHTATMLASGQVLIVGGAQTTPDPFAEVYDPVSGQFTRTEVTPTNRFNHRATRLLSGDVLITGGDPSPNVANTYASAELVREDGQNLARPSLCHVRYLPTIGR